MIASGGCGDIQNIYLWLSTRRCMKDCAISSAMAAAFRHHPLILRLFDTISMRRWTGARHGSFREIRAEDRFVERPARQVPGLWQRSYVPRLPQGCGSLRRV